VSASSSALSPTSGRGRFQSSGSDVIDSPREQARGPRSERPSIASALAPAGSPSATTRPLGSSRSHTEGDGSLEGDYALRDRSLSRGIGGDGFQSTSAADQSPSHGASRRRMHPNADIHKDPIVAQAALDAVAEGHEWVEPGTDNRYDHETRELVR